MVNLNVDEFGANDKRAIVAFRRVLEGEVETYFKAGNEVSPEYIFRDARFPLNGFLPDILPDYVRGLRAESNARVTSSDAGQVISIGEIHVSYLEDLDHKRAIKHWRGKGYVVEPIRQSLKVVRKDRSSERYIAFYGKNVLRVVYENLDEFLENFEPLDPRLDLISPGKRSQQEL